MLIDKPDFVSDMNEKMPPFLYKCQFFLAVSNQNTFIFQTGIKLSIHLGHLRALPSSQIMLTWNFRFFRSGSCYFLLDNVPVRFYIHL